MRHLLTLALLGCFAACGDNTPLEPIDEEVYDMARPDVSAPHEGNQFSQLLTIVSDENGGPNIGAGETHYISYNGESHTSYSNSALKRGFWFGYGPQMRLERVTLDLPDSPPIPAAKVRIWCASEGAWLTFDSASGSAGAWAGSEERTVLPNIGAGVAGYDSGPLGVLMPATNARLLVALTLVSPSATWDASEARMRWSLTVRRAR